MGNHPIYFISKFRAIPDNLDWIYAARYDGWSKEWLNDYGNVNTGNVEKNSLEELANFLASEPDIHLAEIRPAEKSGSLQPSIPLAFFQIGSFSDKELYKLGKLILHHYQKLKYVRRSVAFSGC